MRIVLAGSSFFKHGGGIAPYNRELCRALLERGHELLVISPESQDAETRKPGEHGAAALYSTAIPESVGDELKVAREMFDRIVEYDPQVLISSDHIYLTSMFPCFADSRIRITVSHYYNGLLPKVAACRPGETDWIVAISEAGRQYLLSRRGCCAEQVVVIYNAVHDVNVNVAELIHKKSREDVLRIVYPGGDSRHKSCGTVLKMVKQLARSDLNWELTWLGSADRITWRVPESARKRTLFTGRVPRPEAEQHILKAHCFVLPSRGEGCPMSLLEAMRTGTIPLVSDCPSAMRELVVNGVSGYVARRTDARSFVSHLVEIAKSQPLRESMMKEARLVYEKGLTVDTWINKIASLLGRRRAGRSKLNETDRFDPAMVCRWHRRPGRWQRPTPTYLRVRFGFPNLSPLGRG
ncbi:MAG: glycosyltransferase family 4 protein [Phycisphaerales bacterium]|nr:MAG: glycosyltransferase family 4 protein [Phycisphaerales bacterium]